MSLGLKNNILNQKGTPAFFSDTFANRPAFGFAGRVFISTDTGAIYEDTGSAWTLIADAGAGTTGTLEQVTTNGNTTTRGLVVTSGSVAIGTATAGAPLDIHATGTNAQFNGTGTNNAYLQFQNAGANKWRIGNTYAAGANNLDIYNNSLASNALSFNASTNAATFNNSVTATSLITSGGTSAQFVKGNGTLDSGTYLPITGGISTNQVLKVYSSGGNFYLGSGTMTDNGTSVTIDARVTSNGDTISVNNSASNVQLQINNTTATTGKQWYLNSKSTGILGIGNNTTSDVLTFASTGTATFLQGIQSTGTADQMLQVYGSSPSLRLYNTITSPTITGFVGMATGVNNFILGSAAGDMCIGTSTAGKIFIGTGNTTVNPAITINTSNNTIINNILGINYTPNTWFSGYSVIEMGSGSLVYPNSATNTQLWNNLYVNAAGNTIYKSTGIGGLFSLGGGGNAAVWYTAPSGTIGTTATLTQAMTLTNANNVGIGASTNPQNLLEVSAAGGSNRIRVGTLQNNNNVSYFEAITSSSSTTASSGWLKANYGGGLTLGLSSYTKTGGDSGNFANLSSESQNSILNITSGGNVLIGTTTDYGSKLNVNGNVLASGTGSINGLLSRDNNNSTTYGFVNNGSGSLTLTNSGVANVGNFNMSTGIYTPVSDINKKKDFELSTIGLKEVLQLNPTLYRMKSEDETKDKTLGFIAQEVKEFIPQAYVESNDFIGLTDRPIIAALVKAIQELNDKIEKLNNN